MRLAISTRGVRNHRTVPSSRELFDGLPYAEFNALNLVSVPTESQQCAAERRERELLDVDHIPRQSMGEAGRSQLLDHPSTSGDWPQHPRETERSHPPPSTPPSHPLLWQFLCSLLNRPREFGSIIAWEDQAQKLFRIKKSKELAALWGERKGNPHMTHETLTHGIRSYYGKKEKIVLKSKRRRQLVYQFGPNVRVELY
ncbi:Transcription factor ETV7 [Aphelenchoides fujianensis]|nr:Transcription factor ETV7 [Aphelenchoides fujianensis]